MIVQLVVLAACAIASLAAADGAYIPQPTIESCCGGGAWAGYRIVVPAAGGSWSYWSFTSGSKHLGAGDHDSADEAVRLEWTATGSTTAVRATKGTAALVGIGELLRYAQSNEPRSKM